MLCRKPPSTSSSTGVCVCVCITGGSASFPISRDKKHGLLQQPFPDSLRLLHACLMPFPTGICGTWVSFPDSPSPASYPTMEWWMPLSRICAYFHTSFLALTPSSCGTWGKGGGRLLLPIPTSGPLRCVSALHFLLSHWHFWEGFNLESECGH